LKVKEAARKTLSEWSVSELDLRQDPLFQLKPVRFKMKIRVSEIDRLLYGTPGSRRQTVFQSATTLRE
jgi:hypothetical protein